MARTKQTCRGWRGPVKNVRPQISTFELTMRKYYPKKTRFFYKGLGYQASDANYENIDRRVFQRYKRSFFRSFALDVSSGTPHPSKIPNNLQRLRIIDGSTIFLKKLIKQNKRLEHIVIESKDEDESEDKNFNAKIIRYLKYSKSLRSITFKHGLPYFSEIQCKKMLRTWGKTLERFKNYEFWTRNKSHLTRAIGKILMFPKLKMFKFYGKSLPFEKLQERNIAYNVELPISAFNSSIKKFPESKPAGNVRITMSSRDLKSEKMSLEICKFQKKSNQTLSLYFTDDNGKSNPIRPVFQNISSLDLTIPGYRSKFKCSSLGQLKNLIHLSVEIYDRSEKEIVGDLFRYLDSNVAPHKKLETFLIKTDFVKTDEEEEDDDDEEEKEQKNDAIVIFFEACSQSLKRVHFEFQYSDYKSQYPELFYRGLSKLESLQSLSLFLNFTGMQPQEQVNKLCEVISGMKSLKELDFKLVRRYCQEKNVNIILPPQLKKLSISMDTSYALFNPSKTLGPLTDLTHLELDFQSFGSQKWGKVFAHISDKSKVLEVLVLKKIREDKNGVASQMKERLDKLMKESLNLKLIVFADMHSKKIIILKRNFSWSEINPILADLLLHQEKYMRLDYTKSYV